MYILSKMGMGEYRIIVGSCSSKAENNSYASQLMGASKQNVTFLCFLCFSQEASIWFDSLRRGM